MDMPLQPVTDDSGPLSPWWIRTIMIVMLLGFSGLILITTLSYRNAPPIPQLVLDDHGATLATGADISAGQAVFLKYGLMSNGSIWGHGAYLGPDYSAAALHRMGMASADRIARERFGRAFAELAGAQQAAVNAESSVMLKANRYDARSATLRLTAAQRAAFAGEATLWREYFRHPAGNGGLKAELISDAAELHQFAAFVSWAAWASVAARPGADYSYTNNFPYDPSVGNVPTSSALL